MHTGIRRRWGSAVISLVGVMFSLPGFIQAQFTYEGCAPLQASDFSFEYVFGQEDTELNEPVKMDFDMHSIDNIDIYFVERHGQLNKYTASTGEVTELYDFPQVSSGASGNNDGLVGIALDPNFKTNGWIYLQMSLDDPSVFRLARYKITDGNFDPNSELVILDVPSQRAFWHTGGDMAFDDYGDLWWAIGDNTSYIATANTNSLIGTIARIHPIPVPDGQNPSPGVGTTYTIPDGNLFPEAEDTENKTLPEIYIMGTRNPYTIGIDPVRRWVAWGEVGPDFRQEQEEHNLYTAPGNAGWPFFAGNNIPITVQGGRYDATPTEQDPSAPEVTWEGNTGLSVLPPAIPATYSYSQSCGLSGPIYRYNPELESDVKMPPHFDRTWFVSDCNGANPIWAFDLNDDGSLNSERIDLTQGIFQDVNRARHLDFNEGPDGALYLLKYDGNYGSGPDAGLVRITYNGTCRPGYPDHPRMEKAGCMDPANSLYDPTATHDAGCEGGTRVAHFTHRSIPGIHLDNNFSLRILSDGPHRVEVTDVSGRVVYSESSDGQKTYSLKGLTGSALYIVRVTNRAGTWAEKLLF